VVLKARCGAATQRIDIPQRIEEAKMILEWFATKASTPRLAFRHALSLTLVLTLKICVVL
jgi:hypothetical protein